MGLRKTTKGYTMDGKTFYKTGAEALNKWRAKQRRDAAKKKRQAPKKKK